VPLLRADRIFIAEIHVEKIFIERTFWLVTGNGHISDTSLIV